MHNKPKSWRDVLPVHPAAELFPRMSVDELRALGEDIKKSKTLTHSIVLWSPGVSDAPVSLLDGISRLDAMELVGLETVKDGKLWPVPNPDYPSQDFIDHRSEFTLNILATGKRLKTQRVRDTDPWTYVISANYHRRHFTAEQKRELIVKLLKAMPKKSNRQIAAARAELERRGQIDHAETGTDTKGRAQPARKSAKKANGRDEAGPLDFILRLLPNLAPNELKLLQQSIEKRRY